MVATALLAGQYPASWYDHNNRRTGSCDDFFTVTPVLQRMATGNKSKEREEADAGAGGGSSKAKAQDEMGMPYHENEQSHQLKSALKPSSEMDHNEIETAAAELNRNELAERVELSCNESGGMLFASNHHRSSLLNMLSGKSHSVQVTTQAALLFAAILENDAIDDHVLETLGVLPLSEPSPFECAIAEYLETRIVGANFASDTQYQNELATATKYLGSLGLMMLEVSLLHWNYIAPLGWCL